MSERDHIIQLALTDEERATISYAAREDGQRFDDFVREAALMSADVLCGRLIEVPEDAAAIDHLIAETHPKYTHEADRLIEETDADDADAPS